MLTEDATDEVVRFVGNGGAHVVEHWGKPSLRACNVTVDHVWVWVGADKASKPLVVPPVGVQLRHRINGLAGTIIGGSSMSLEMVV